MATLPSAQGRHGQRVWGFQSIGVTKEWRLHAFALPARASINGFPINRRHQRMATGRFRSLHQALSGFQSIGVTKEWRPLCSPLVGVLVGRFPINRRHQRMATFEMRDYCFMRKDKFPINRRHQRMATLDPGKFSTCTTMFPINRRHQRMATVTDLILRIGGD